MNLSEQTQKLMTDIIYALPTDLWQTRLVPDHDHLGERVLSTEYTRGQLINSVRFLRNVNREGRHVYGRPATNRHILVDDLDQDALDQMKLDGLEHAVAVQTSKANYQAWVTVSDTEISRETASAAAKILAQRYEGDPCSAGYSHLGRLPGFTNRKEIHWSETGYPFTRFRGKPKRLVAPRSLELLVDAERLPSSPDFTLPLPSTHGAGAPNTSTSTNLDIDPSRSTMTAEEASEIYTHELRLQAARNNWSLPIEKGFRSSGDFEVVRGLYLRETFELNDLAALLMYESEKAAERAPRARLDYVVATVEAASQYFGLNGDQTPTISANRFLCPTHRSGLLV
jgi:hypothetical protein